MGGPVKAARQRGGDQRLPWVFLAFLGERLEWLEDAAAEQEPLGLRGHVLYGGAGPEAERQECVIERRAAQHCAAQRSETKCCSYHV